MNYKYLVLLVLLATNTVAADVPGKIVITADTEFDCGGST